MNSWPVIHRELLVRARQPGTHRLRWLAAGLAMLAALPALMGGAPSPAALGRQLFVALTVLALAWCLFEGARQTSDCLSEEKREGTLGLLFLTDLTGGDVVLGKLAAASLNSFYSLLAITPVLALPVLAGGITGGEFARVTLVLVNTLFLALAAGMWVSSRNREEMKSLFATLGLLGAILTLPLLSDFMLHTQSFSPRVARLALASPGFSWYLAQNAGFRGAPGGFWVSLGIIHALGWFLLGLAAWKVRREVQEDGFSDHRQVAQMRSGTDAPLRRQRGGRLLEKDPTLWLALRSRGVLLWVWLAAAVLVFGAATQSLLYRVMGLGLPMFGWGLWGYAQSVSNLAIRFMIAYLACRFFSDARRTGTLEPLLCTPLRRDDILRGQRRALRRMLLVPLLVAVLLQTAVSLNMLYGGGILHGFLFWLKPATLTAFMRFVMLAADALALTWFGMWSAWRAPRPAAAVTRTFLLAAVLPWLANAWTTRLFSVSIFGIFPIAYGWSSWLAQLAPSLLMDAALIWWARRRLRAEFCASEPSARQSGS